jgi:hypothetical protein
MTRAEWESLKFGGDDATATDPALSAAAAAAGALPPGGGLVAAALARELRLEAFRADFTAFNAGGDATNDFAAPRPRRPLLACAFGLGNTLSLVNDGRAEPSRYDESYGGSWHARPSNTALVEVLVHEWPALVLVTLVPIAQGEELLRSYGEDQFWRGWDELAARLRQVTRAAAATAATAAAAVTATAAGAATAPALAALAPTPPATVPPPPQVLAAAPPVATAMSAAAAAPAAPAPAPVGYVAAANICVEPVEATSRDSGAASCRTDAQLLPDASPATRMGGWVACGATQLFKAAGCADDALCALAAHAPPGACPADWTLLDALALSGLTKGADVAAALAPLLRSSALGSDASLSQPPLLLLSPATGADAASRGRFGRLVARLATNGKAAFCSAAGSSGSAAYLVAGGTAFADAQLAAAATMPDKQHTAAPYLLALVLPPAQSADGTGAAATSETVPCAAADDVALPAAATPAPASACALVTAAAAQAHTPTQTDGAAAPQPAVAEYDDTPADGEADAPSALRTAAAAALAAASPPGALPLSQLTRSVPHFLPRHVSVRVNMSALHAALAAGSRRFELVPQYCNGAPRTMVYLLREVPPCGDGRRSITRVTPPETNSAAANEYARRLLAWLRDQGRWCSRQEVLAALPPPVAPHGAQSFLHVRMMQLVDHVATARNNNLLAALRDGAPPGPPPVLPASAHIMPKPTGGGPAAVAPAAAAVHFAAPVAAQGGMHASATAQDGCAGSGADDAPLPHANFVQQASPPPLLPLPLSPPALPPPLPDYEDTSAAAEDSAAALRTAAVAALLAATPRGTLTLQMLLSSVHRFLPVARPELRAGASADALRAALHAAPRRFHLAPQFIEAPRTTVYLLRESPDGSLSRVTPPAHCGPTRATYKQRLVTWLRARGRWCTREEVLDDVPPPAPYNAAMSYFRGCLAELADDIAVADSERLFAALRDGAPPGPPALQAPAARALVAAHGPVAPPSAVPLTDASLPSLLFRGYPAAVHAHAASLSAHHAPAAADARLRWPPASASAFLATRPIVAPPPPPPSREPLLLADAGAANTAAMRCVTWGAALGEQLGALRNAALWAVSMASAQQEQQQRNGMPVIESLLSCCVLVLLPLPPPLSSVARLCELLSFVGGGAPVLATQNVDEWVNGARTQGVLVRFEQAVHARAARGVHGQRLGGQPLWVTAAHRAPSSQVQQAAWPRKRSRSRSPEQPHRMPRPWRQA